MIKRAMVKSVGSAGLERIELQRLTERIGWLFSLLQEAAAAQAPTVAGAWSPLIDVCETTQSINVRIELPDVRAADVKVRVSENKLRVGGEKKKRAARQRTTSHHCSERIYGRFERVVPLRWPIDRKHATAELGNGILLVRLPKLKDRRGLEVTVAITEKDSAK
jgi:HSP20 family protein